MGWGGVWSNGANNVDIDIMGGECYDEDGDDDDDYCKVQFNLD